MDGRRIALEFGLGPRLATASGSQNMIWVRFSYMAGNWIRHDNLFV